jgi:tetratricopeptide (TPR) repeat protein
VARSGPRSSSAGFSRSRTWLFRGLGLACPLLLLALVEMALRLGGVGYPTGFLLRSRVPDPHAPASLNHAVWIDNQKFGWRFFPPAIAREPQALLLRTEKAPRSCRIFVFGESAALGDPAPDYGLPRLLEVLLRERYPGVEFEVVNAAMIAINSHVVREIARDCAQADGDVWVVYMGNNEVVGPYGSGTVFNARAPALFLIRASILFQKTRLGQWLAGLLRPGRPAAEWQGMEMFLKQQVRQDDPKMATVYHHFQKNLEAILALAKRGGMPVLLSTVACNLKHSPPFASLHKKGLSQSQLDRWDELFAAGNRLQEPGQAASALASFDAAAKIDDRHAGLQFRRGQCLLSLNQPDQAKAAFGLARDLDTLRFRADGRLNEIIRQVAAGRTGVKLLDAAELFDRASPHGLAGEEFFFEHVHFTFEGNFLLASNVAAQLEPLLPERVRSTAVKPAPWLSIEECARRLALTDWNRLSIAQEVRQRLQQPPFSGQLDQSQRDQRWAQLIAGLADAAKPARLQQSIEMARTAVLPRPADWILRRNLAKLLETRGETAAAMEEWRQIMRALPHRAEAFYRYANLVESEGRHAEALANFQTALRLNPFSVETLNGLGLVLAATGQPEQALQTFQQALKLRPRFLEARVNLGQTLAALGRETEARGEYETCLRLDTNCSAAHLNLGKLLSAQGQTLAAVQHYQEALRLMEGHPVAHFNLANALAALGRSEEAINHYLAAVQVQPDFPEARSNLGQELDRAGRPREALVQFLEVVKLRPQQAGAHFNLGVALARAQRFDEAALQFRETLRLQPGYPMAQDYLGQVEKKPRP